MIDGGALEDDGHEKAEIVSEIRPHCPPNISPKFAVGSLWKDTEVEENDGGPHEVASDGVE